MAKATMDIEQQMAAVQKSAQPTASHIKGIWNCLQKTDELPPTAEAA